MLSAFHSIAVGASLIFFLKIAGGLIAALLAYGAGKREETRESLYLVFVLGGLGVCAVGYLFWLVAGSDFPYLTSTFYQSDVFGGYLLLLIPLSASLAVFSESALRRIIYGCATLFFIMTLVFTYSRGALLIFLVIASAWGFLLREKKPRAVKAGAVALLASAALAAIYIALARGGMLARSLHEKMMSRMSWSSNTGARLSFWKGALKIFAHHPFLGSGPDTFGRLFPLYQEKFFWYSRFPHSFYLQVLSDQGIFSLVLTAGFVLTVLIQGYRALKRECESFPLVLGLFLAFLGGALHLFLDVDSNFVSWGILFWGEGGLLLAYAAAGSPGASPRAGSAKGLRAALVASLIALSGLQFATAAAAIYDGKAQLAEQAGKFDLAVFDTDRAILFFPLDAEYRDHRARLELAMYSAAGVKSRLVQAKEDLEEALSLDPVKPVYLGELAGVDAALPGGKDEAIALLDRALAFDPWNYPEHYVRLADLEAENGLTTQARNDYSEVIARFPEADLGRLMFFRRGDYAEALAMAHLGLGKLALQKRQTGEAEAEIRKASLLTPDDPAVSYYSGVMAMSTGDWKAAAAELSRGVYTPGLSAEGWKWLSLSDLRLKRGNEALSAVKRAFAYPEKDATLYLIAGEIYALNREPAGAMRMWESGLKRYPEDQALNARIKAAARR